MGEVVGRKKIPKNVDFVYCTIFHIFSPLFIMELVLLCIQVWNIVKNVCQIHTSTYIIFSKVYL